MRTPSSLRRHRTSAEVPACTTALVTSSLVRTTASSTMSAKPQPWRVSRTKERAVATDRPTGSKLAAARAVITELLVRLSACEAPWPTRSCRGRAWFPVGRGSWGGPPGCSPVVMVRRPSDACPLVLVPPPRPDGTGAAGQPHARLLTFAVHADAGRHCFRPEGVRTVCEAAELLWPGSAMVKHWASFRRRSGQGECLPERRAVVPEYAKQ